MAENKSGHGSPAGARTSSVRTSSHLMQRVIDRDTFPPGSNRCRAMLPPPPPKPSARPDGPRCHGSDGSLSSPDQTGTSLLVKVPPKPTPLELDLEFSLPVSFPPEEPPTGRASAPYDVFIDAELGSERTQTSVTEAPTLPAPSDASILPVVIAPSSSLPAISSIAPRYSPSTIRVRMRLTPDARPDPLTPLEGFDWSEFDQGTPDVSRAK
jgi:hypothetical protein